MSFPSKNRVMPSAEHAFLDMAETCMGYGEESEPDHSDKCYEVLDYHCIIANPRARVIRSPIRAVNMGYAAASVGWNLGLRHDVASITKWNPIGAKFSDDGVTFNGANYGARFMDHLFETMDFFRKVDNDSRRAWTPLLGTRDNDYGKEYKLTGKDFPCTIGFALRIKPDENKEPCLVMQVIMRSQNAWGVFPYDVYLMSVVHELVANSLGIKLGPLSWHCMSLHLYERDWLKAREYITAEKARRGGMQWVEDRQIDYDLESAMQVYPGIFRELTGIDPTGIPYSPVPGDPVVLEMTQGKPQVTVTA